MSADIKRKMRLLIIGPHSAKPLEAPKRFNLWAKALQSEGYFVHNPVVIERCSRLIKMRLKVRSEWIVDYLDWAHCLMTGSDIQNYLVCSKRHIDAIFALRGWENDALARQLMAAAIHSECQILLEAK